MKHNFKSLETYIVDNIQTREFSNNIENQSIRINFSIIKIALYQYLRFDGESRKLACYTMEVASKQLKNLIIPQGNSPFHRVIDCLRCTLDALLEVTGQRDNEFLEHGREFKHIKLGRINITRKTENMIERYKNDLIFSAFIICHYLCLDWPPEIKSRCEKIDEILDRRKCILEEFSESLVGNPASEN